VALSGPSGTHPKAPSPMGGPSPMAAATRAPPAAAAALAPEGSMGSSVPGFSRRSTMYSLHNSTNHIVCSIIYYVICTMCYAFCILNTT